MFNFFKTLYTASPVFLKTPIKHVPYKWIAGQHYRHTLASCRMLDKLPRQDILNFQEKVLGDLLKFAVIEVPFYRAYRSAIEKYKPFDAIQEFPFLSKEIVQEQLENLNPVSIDAIPHHIGTTGGSSGNQLSFLEDNSTYSKEMGFIHSQWNRVGYKPKYRKATFRGVQFSKISNDIFWQENPIHNELQFSPFHMSEENLKFYCKRMISYAPEFLHGYPSTIDILSEYVIRYDLKSQFRCLKAILLGSEACTDSQRSRIEEAFGRRVYMWYGQSERVILGGECEQSRCYHAFPNYGYLEIIKENGEYAYEGERGEIVGTGFMNRSMPLIRYKTDDTAIKIKEPCSCGRQWDLFSDVIGRWNLECVYGRSGAKISAAALNMHGNLFKNTIRYQYCQDTVGDLLIRVIPNEAFSGEDERRIIQEHNQKLWGELDISIEHVNDIPLTASGKQSRIICNVRR
jgi:phenylacetate-CoA ligase